MEEETEYEPELGQLLFGNAMDFDKPMQEHVEAGIALLGQLVKNKTEEKTNPCENTGAEFENEVFSIRSYCWCDGGRTGHEDACPANFICGDFQASWYKYLGRGSTQNKKVSADEWTQIMKKCLDSLK